MENAQRVNSYTSKLNILQVNVLCLIFSNSYSIHVKRNDTVGLLEDLLRLIILTLSEQVNSMNEGDDVPHQTFMHLVLEHIGYVVLDQGFFHHLHLVQFYYILTTHLFHQP
jgi:HD-like signal output (HDOD) protein